MGNEGGKSIVTSDKNIEKANRLDDVRESGTAYACVSSRLLLFHLYLAAIGNFLHG